MNNESTKTFTEKELRNIVERIFGYGAYYNMAISDPDRVYPGEFPVDDYNKSIDYVYRLVINGEIDDNCSICGRYHNDSCKGTLPRTDGKKCAAFYNHDQRNSTSPIDMFVCTSDVRKKLIIEKMRKVDES